MIDYSWAKFSKNGTKQETKPVKSKTIPKAKEKVKKGLVAKTQLKSKTPLKKSDKPIKQVSKKKSSVKRPKKELCIMPPNTFYKTKREEGLIRHEVFFGRKQRDLSIKYGLVIFITAEQHTESDKSIHKNKELDSEMKQVAQREFEKVYTELNFLKVFGKNYI